MDNRLNILVTCLGIATVAVTTLAVRQWPELGRQRDANAALLERVRALEAQQLAPPVPPATADSSSASAAGPAGDAAPVVPAGAAQPTPQQPPEGSRNAPNPMAGMLEAMQSPQGRDFMRTMMRSAMTEMYPDVAAELGLSAEETDRLFDLIVKQQEELTAESMGMLTGAMNDPAAMQEAQRKMVEQQEAHERELTAMLGGRYAKWQEYQTTAVARQQVGQLRTSLSASGNPLSEAQEKSLVTAFAREQARVTREQRDWMASSAAVSSPNMMQESLEQALDAQRRLVDIAAPILDAAQLSQYKRQVEQQAGMMGAAMGMMGGQGAAP